MQEVGGSIPPGSTNHNFFQAVIRWDSSVSGGARIIILFVIDTFTYATYYSVNEVWAYILFNYFS